MIGRGSGALSNARLMGEVIPKNLDSERFVVCKTCLVKTKVVNFIVVGIKALLGLGGYSRRLIVILLRGKRGSFCVICFPSIIPVKF